MQGPPVSDGNFLVFLFFFFLCVFLTVSVSVSTETAATTKSWTYLSILDILYTPFRMRLLLLTTAAGDGSPAGSTLCKEGGEKEYTV